MQSRCRRLRGQALLLAIVLVCAAPAGSAQSADGFPDSRFIEQRERFVSGDGGAVEVRFLIARESQARTTRIVDAARAAVTLLSTWFGELPSPALTIAGTPWRGGFTSTSQPGIAAFPIRWLAPVRDQSMERALIGALTRQYFSPVPSPFEETLIVYVATRAIHQLLEGSNFETTRSFGGYVPLALRSMLLSPPVGDPRPRVWGFPELAPFGDTARINAGVRAMQTIERYAGWPATLQAISRLRSAPGERDAAAFAAILSEVRASDLRSLVAECFNAGVVFDYRIVAMDSRPAPSGLIETTVLVRRDSQAQFALRHDGDVEPVLPIVVRFADGTETRDYFDGAAADTTLVYSAKAAAVAAMIDPDRMLLLDRNRADNAIFMNRPASKLGIRLALHWMSWLQNAMLSYTALL